MTEPDSYAAVHRYDGAVIERGRRDQLVPCAVQPRDLAIVRDLWRYKFLTTDQLLELWWPDASPQAARRRLVKLFRAGYLDRFRPLSRRGSYPWTYQLGREGHRMLRAARAIPDTDRFKERTIHDFGYVLHDLQLNAWALAWRRILGEALIEWHGETDVSPPTGLRVDAPLRLDGEWSAENLREPRPRLLRPDAVIEVEDDPDRPPTTYFIEFDRTRRVDKNHDKFRRYDAFLTWWRPYSEFGGLDEPPTVVFICQDNEHARLFLTAADRQVTGYQWHTNARVGSHYVGRDHILFAVELDMHAGQPRAYQVPGHPRDPYADDPGQRTVRLTSLVGDSESSHLAA